MATTSLGAEYGPLSEFAARLQPARTFTELVSGRADATPDGVFLIAEDGMKVTFGEYRDRSERIAAWLTEQGITAGSRVAWQLPTRIGSALLIAALARIGAVQAPVLPLFGERETVAAFTAAAVDFVLVPEEWPGFGFESLRQLRQDRRGSPEITVVSRDLAESDAVKSLQPRPEDPDEIRWIHFTSGTSGTPKGVQHTDSSILAAARGFVLNGRLGELSDEVGSIPFPITHVGGVVYLSSMLLSGFASVLIEAYRPDTATETFRRHRVTLSGGSTVFYTTLVAQQRSAPAGTRILPDLRLLKGGGAPCPPAVFAAVRSELGVPVAHDYGMTECPMICVASPLDSDEDLAESDGRPVPGVEVRIVLDGVSVLSGAEGEIEVRGATMCSGYTAPELNAEAFTDDGWYRTGDRGRLRPSGCLEVTGRMKDVIIRKGENISPLEIESLLSQHGAVDEVAVIGLPDAERGERVCAVFTVAAGTQPPSLCDVAEFLTEAGIMKQKIPEQIEIVTTLPRSGVGKISKRILQQQIIAQMKATKS
ncbi:class I adenylate-forming enzyme family protein [Rhodococcoides yunnanense]|nr:AMP-binding protein [Rhodococcus yunnanensis]